MKILIINTGVGNIDSIKNILNRLGYESKISDLEENFQEYNCFIIPGVGNFDRAIKELKKYKDYHLLINRKYMKNKLIIGICLGMQILFQNSEEGVENGLGLLEGSVIKFNQKNIKIPHMGWNNVYGDNFFSDLNREKFYFAHSYYVDCDEKYVYAYCDYKIKFPAIVKSGNIYGIQFHPEKSNVNGLKLLKKILSENIKW